MGNNFINRIGSFAISIVFIGFVASIIATHSINDAVAREFDPTDVGVRVEKPVGDGKTFSQGSGVLVRDGLILTAAHVVKYNPADQNINIIISGLRLNGHVVSIDEKTDLALVEVDRSAVPLRNHDITVAICDHDPGPGKIVLVSSIGEVTQSVTVAFPDMPNSAGWSGWTKTVGTGYHQGSSGGGVFDVETGCLLGILIFEIKGRVRPESLPINVTRYAPAPELLNVITKYQAQNRINPVGVQP